MVSGLWTAVATQLANAHPALLSSLTQSPWARMDAFPFVSGTLRSRFSRINHPGSVGTKAGLKGSRRCRFPWGWNKNSDVLWRKVQGW